MSGVVQFSRDAGCFIWLCEWGCSGTDHEGRGEAEEAFIAHACDRRCP